MCTATTLKDTQNNFYFGRNMDFSYPLNPSIFVAGRNYKLHNQSSNIEITNKYRFMGIGQNIPNTVFVEGVNEMGLAAAVLYFPGYAKYDTFCSTNNSHQYCVDSLEVVPFLLGNCKDIEDAYYLLQHTSILGVVDAVTNTVAPLHWIVTDRTGKCMVIENRMDGLYLLDNPIGVLSNSPNFEWHLTNLRNYMDLSSVQDEMQDWGSVVLTPFGQGAGTLGLPGDFTPPSRFVRTAFLKTHTLIPTTQKESITTFFHIMESVTVPKGTVITHRGTSDYTQYTSFIDLQSCEYFFKTYDNSTILHCTFPSNIQEGDILEIGKLNDASSFEMI